MKASKYKMDSEFRMEIDRQIRHAMPEMHYHDFYEIYIQDLGTHEHIVNSSFFKLSPHDVMLLKPHILHQSISLDLHTRTVIYFTDKFLHAFFSEQAVKELMRPFQYEVLSLSPEHYYRAAALVNELSHADFYHLAPSTYLNVAELLVIFAKSIEEHPGLCSKKQNPDPLQHSPAIQSPLITYVHENFLTLTNLEEIADTFFITPSHMCRTFKKLTGFTIFQYINMLKIQKACELLHNTQKSITDIAMECGFNSAMYFGRTFKATLGLTPTEYRQMNDCG